jgi:hypothetical protein
MSTNYNTVVIANPALAESGKFIDLSQNTRFPSVSVTRIKYPDTTQAFPGNTGARPITSVEIYPKYGIISYIANTDEFAVTLSAGQVNLDTGLIEAHLSNIDPATQAIELNTFDTLTAVVAFNNNFMRSVSALSASIVNPITVSNLGTYVSSITANQATQITLEKTLSANSVYGTLSSQPVFVTVPTTAPLNVSYADSVQLDQNSRLRISGLQNQWWYTSVVDKDGDVRLNEAFVNPATSTFIHGASSRFVQNLASVNLTSGLSSTGSVIRASRRRHKIIPGLSHEYSGSWNFDGYQPNVIKRMGMFTNFNGYFFELSGSDFNVVVRRRLPDGTLVEERVRQDAFNGDKLDGNGPSGENWNNLTTTAAITGYVSTTPINIGATTVYNVVYGLSAGQAGNFRQGTKATFSGISPVTYNQVGTIIKSDTTTNRLTACYTIDPNTYSSLTVSPSAIVQTAYHMQHSYWIDWLGGRTNRVRFGKASDYGNIVLHTFRFDNLLGTAYENAPALMDRKEILNVGPVSGTPSFTVMGNSFNIEAEATLNPNFVIAHNDTGVAFTANTAGTEFPILGVGLRTGEPYQRADLQIQAVNIIDTANAGAAGNKAIQYGTFAWRLVLNPGLSGVPAPIDIGKASRHWEYTTTSKLTAEGIELTGGLYVSNASNEVKTALNFFNMGSNIDYTDADKVVLLVKQLGTAATNAPNVVAQMNLIEAL